MIAIIFRILALTNVLLVVELNNPLSGTDGNRNDNYYLNSGWFFATNGLLTFITEAFFLTGIFSFAFKNWVVSREMPDMMLQSGMLDSDNKYTPFC
jgi:hypothetical protein